MQRNPIVSEGEVKARTLDNLLNKWGLTEDQFGEALKAIAKQQSKSQ